MSSVSFDPVAHIYDATRGYPENITRRIAQEIDRTVQAKTQTAFLELGVGTGRIGLPLASLGRTYTGVDISQGMLSYLETKLRDADWQEHGETLLPWGSLWDENSDLSLAVSRFTRAEPPSSLRLVRADIEHLPFRKASFDVIIAVHVFHLVDDWQQAVREALRVLRPGGWLLHCWDGYQNQMSDRQLINERWREIVHELQGETHHVGATYSALKQWLHERSLQPEERCVLTWEQPVIPSDVIESIAQRSWSSSWRIPDDIFIESVARLRDWAEDYYGDTIKQQRMQERYFAISKTHVHEFS
jgi:ubiquinone/menaquinone biosynthesis C-methylase UbiE